MNDNSDEATSLGEIIIMLMMIMATMMRRWDDDYGDNDDDDGHNDDDETGIRALERWLEIWSCRRTLSQTVTNETTPQTCPQFLFWTRIILMTILWWWWYKQWSIDNERLGKAWKNCFFVGTCLKSTFRLSETKCRKFRTSTPLLYIHQTRQHDKTSYSCGECGTEVIGKMALNNHKRESIWKRNTYWKIITTQISQRLLFLETGPNIFFVMAGLGVVAEE